MATALLSEKFGVAKHKVTSGAEGGDQAKSLHVQQVVSIYIKLKKVSSVTSQWIGWKSV